MEITDVNTLFGAYPSQHPDSNAESLVATMGSQGVAYCLTLSTYGLFYRDVDGNAETMRACRSHDHLIPVATLNPATYWGQPGLLESITSEPFEMFRFFPQAQGWPLDFAPFAAILSQLASLPRMPIMVSVRLPGDITTLAHIAANYPHPIILEGVSLPILAEAITVLRSNPRFYLETHALAMPDSLTLLRDTLGMRRILFGSDAPGMSLGAALRFVRRSGLNETEQNAVLGGNAQHIWQGGEEE
jgi:predicted TIM-barrel fold metal-dependent hydrolase